MLELYTAPTPNGWKASVALEELELEYSVRSINLAEGEQKEPGYLALCPNGRVPTLVDEGFPIFESGAILLYLAEKTGKFLGAPEARGEVLSWLMFIATGVGPYSGQAVHFQHFAPEKLAYAVNRYRREVERHYGILDDQLEGRDFLVGGEFTIVDMAAWGWLDRSKVVLGDGELDKYANLKRWFDAIDARPAVQRARDIAKGIEFKSERDEAAMRALFPQNYAA